MNRRHFAAYLALLGLLGCGVGCGDQSVPVTPVERTPEEAMKGTLEQYVRTGELDSGTDSLAQEIDRLRATDPAKADALQASYEKLISQTAPQQVKSNAQAMIDKL